MTNIWTSLTARKQHRCHMCGRIILPGETYWRMAGLDHGQVWTYKACPHCYRVAAALNSEEEWDTEVILECLADEHPALWASLRAGWRYPDGDLLPLPFQPR